MSCYRIVDDSSIGGRNAKVFSPNGEDITHRVVGYVITRAVTEKPTVIIECVGPVDEQTEERTHVFLSGRVVCEITDTKVANAS